MFHNHFCERVIVLLCEGGASRINYICGLNEQCLSVLNSCICILNPCPIAVFGEVMAFLIFGALLIQIKYIMGCGLWEYMRLTTQPIYSLCFPWVVEMKSQCCGLKDKCPLQVYEFEFLVPSMWCGSGGLWNLPGMEPSYRKSVVGVSSESV